MPLVGAVIAK